MPRPAPRILLIAVVAAALVAGSAVGAALALTARAGGPVDLRVTDSPSGSMVVTGTGLTVYVYLPDPTSPPASVCRGDCANDWPPVPAPTSGGPRLRGIAASAVGVLARAGGVGQLTLGGHPLYRFAGDHRPGDAYGESVGNAWFAVGPDGSFLGAPPIGFHGADRPTAVLRVVHTRSGPVVADGAGQTLYAYKDDSSTHVACTAAWCIQDWPPLTVPNLPGGQAGVPGRLGVVKRPDGSLQLTLAGHPLYRFAADTAPGDTRGAGIGGDWYLLTPAGAVVVPGARGRSAGA